MNMDIDKCDYQTIIKYNRDNLQTHDTNIELSYNKQYCKSTINNGLNPLMFDSNHSTPLTNRPSEPVTAYSKPQLIDLSGNISVNDNPIE